MKLPATVSIGLLLSTSSAMALETVTDPSDLFAELPIVTAVSMFPQVINQAPTSVTIIDRRMIEASGALEVADLFRLVPGFDVYYRAGGFAGVSYGTFPGAWPGNLEIKVDGRSVYEIFLNTVVWSSLGLELDDIDYIEVVRGPNSAVDGGNSFTGSIHIHTRSALAINQQSVRAQIGSRGERKLSAQLSEAGEDYAFSITGSYREADGFPSYQGYPVEDAFEDRYLGVKAEFAPSLYDTVSVQLGSSRKSLGITGGGRQDDPYETLPFAFDSNYQSVNWRRQLSDGDVMQLAAYHNYNAISVDQGGVFTFSQVTGGLSPKLFYSDFPDDDFSVNFDLRDEPAERYEVELRYIDAPQLDYQYSWGVSLRRDEAISRLFFTDDSKHVAEGGRVFADGRYQFTPDLTANLGGSFESNSIKDAFGAVRASLNYQWDAATTLRTAFSRTLRAPTLAAADEYLVVQSQGYVFDIDRIASPDMGLERINVVELGLYGVYWQGRLTVDAKVMFERADDLIESYTDTNYPDDFDRRVGFRDNAVDVDSDGFELQVRYEPDARWLMLFNYSYRDMQGEAIRRLDDGPNSHVNMYDSAPSHKAGLLLSYEGEHAINYSANVYYQSAASYLLGHPTPDYARVDLRVGKYFAVGENADLGLELVVRNALNEDIVEYQVYNVMDRAYLVRASLNW